MEQTRSKRAALERAKASATLDVQGLSILVIELTGTFTATTIFEYTINGTDWYTLSTGSITTGVSETGATAVGKWSANVAGFALVRVRCSAFTSGSIAVTLRANLTGGGGISGGSGSSSGGITSTASANTPSIASAATALAANPARKGWQIQNLGTNPLFVRLGASASTSVFHAVLKGGTGNDDGLGGSLSQMSGVIYTDIITIAGTSPRYTVTEL